MPRRAKCRHGNLLCSTCIVADDAAWRAFNEVRNVVAHTDYDTRVHSFITIRLSDGEVNGTLYDSKKAAVRHCRGSEQHYAFLSFRNEPDGFATPKDAAVFLAWHRMAYDAGMRLPDPDDAAGGPDLIMPDMREHLANQMRRLAAGSN